MKLTIYAGLASTLLIGSAAAADLRAPVKAPPPAPVIVAYNWTGFYIGAHVGGAWGRKEWVDFETGGFGPLGSHDVSGFLAGGQVGVNWQAPGSNWVLGIEGDGSWTDASGDHTFGPLSMHSKLKWLATVTGRLGYAWDRVLIYAKGGVAFAGIEHDLLFGVAAPIAASADKSRTGWTVGGGIEYAFAGNWSFKAEYNFMDFGDKDVTFVGPIGGPGGPLRIDSQVHVAKFGINYRFGGFGGPVVARY